MITLSELAEKHNYLSNIPFIFDSNIWEFDIRQANINTLRAFNRISEEDYYRLATGPKMDREITIGNWIKRDPSIQTDIYRGITEAKFNLMNQFGISPDQVLRIANDAVYIVSSKLLSNDKYIDVNVNGNPITFVQKGHYNYFMNLKMNNILFFFGLGDIYGYDVDVIGINDKVLPMHHFFLSFLCALFDNYDVGGKAVSLQVFNNFYNDYINRRLDIEFYREFNSLSGYRFNTSLESFVIQSLDQKYIDRIDINYNLNILRTIYSYLIAA